MSQLQRILVIGAGGQIGSELTPALRRAYGPQNVVAADLAPVEESLDGAGPAIQLNITDRAALDKALADFEIDTIVNLAAILSATGERMPQKCWEVNVDGLLNVLEAAREHKLARVLCPSSIAVFGPDTPRHDTPQETVLRPTTMYGVTKVAGELLCDYYFQRFGVDARGLRYPGIVSAEALPGGGTTDYAVEIFYKAVEEGRYTCFLGPDTALPMMYMPDCLKATLDLLAAPVESLRHHGDFNVAAMTFTPAQLAAEIRKHIPDFEIEYAPDYRQQIADSWPASIDDSVARAEWGWQPAYDLAAMVEDMLARLRARHEAGSLYATAK
jgi:nucleoside-diphosphate-sugar epimerase